MLDEKLFYACMAYCTSFTQFMCAKEKKRISRMTDPKGELNMRMSLAFAKDNLKHDFDNLKEAMDEFSK